MLRRRPNRPLDPNGFEQRYLAGTHAATVGKIKSNGKMGRAHIF
jgi:hypothetical protein